MTAPEDAVVSIITDCCCCNKYSLSLSGGSFGSICSEFGTKFKFVVLAD